MQHNIYYATNYRLLFEDKSIREHICNSFSVISFGDFISHINLLQPDTNNIQTITNIFLCGKI